MNETHTLKTNTIVGILLITHEDLGASLIRCVEHILGGHQIAIETMGVLANDCCDAALARAQALHQSVNQGAGVLVLTDIFGATPSNVAHRLLDLPDTRLLTGVSLPMLLRALCYRRAHDLQSVSDKALEGGQLGMIGC